MNDRRPAEALFGLTLENGWTVTDAVARSDDATGGMYSVSYIVERETPTGLQTGFLKALDYSIVHEMDEPFVDALKKVTDAYVFERDLVRACADKGMSNVVRAVDAGEVDVDPDTIGAEHSALRKVPYIIFEVADGDVRTAIDVSGRAFDVAWSMRVLHGVANGLRQLHQANVFHQDLKPSNVMTFDDIGKVGDLGCAATADSTINGEDRIVGDRTYAPPELHYREFLTDVRVRRLAIDTYQLGSVAAFLFCGAGLTSLIEAQLDPAFHWRNWPRDYENALPYVRDAFNRVLDQMAEDFTSDWGSNLISVMRELGDPDPLRRGSPNGGVGISRYRMDRYVSRFDLLARKAEHALRNRFH